MSANGISFLYIMNELIVRLVQNFFLFEPFMTYLRPSVFSLKLEKLIGFLVTTVLMFKENVPSRKPV